VAASYLALNKSEATSDYYPRLNKNIQAIAQEWSENINIVSRSFKDLHRSRFVEVKYEDLVSEPQKTLGRLCAHLGVEFTDIMLDYHIINKRDNLEPIEFLAWKSRILEQVDNSSIGRYKSLGKDNLRLFENIAMKSLSRYGYI
jgi:hypothetical protein